MRLLLVFSPRLAHSCAHPLAHTLALFVCPQGLLPRAAPLSACPLPRLPPPLPRGTWASCWRVDFSSLCKQVVAACQVGRRQAGAALQPGCAKHRGTAWWGEMGRHPGRERERRSDADRQTQERLVGHRSGNGRQKIALYCPAQPHNCPGPLPRTTLAESSRPVPSPWASPPTPTSPPTSTPQGWLRHYKFITGISPQAKKNLTYFLDGSLG